MILLDIMIITASVAMACVCAYGLVNLIGAYADWKNLYNRYR